MKRYPWLAFALIFFLVGCQPAAPFTITITDGDKIITLQSDKRVPSALLNQAGIKLDPKDRVFLNGLLIIPNQPITNYPITLQIRRTIGLTLNTPDGQQQVQSSALTVGEALQELDYWLRAEDEIEPALYSPITEGMAITITSPRELTISLDGKTLQIRSSA